MLMIVRVERAVEPAFSERNLVDENSENSTIARTAEYRENRE